MLRDESTDCFCSLATNLSVFLITSVKYSSNMLSCFNLESKEHVEHHELNKGAISVILRL